MLKNSKQPLIFFSNYCEIRKDEFVYKNRLLQIKRFLLMPLRLSIFRGSRFIRRRSLSLGNAICCPSVTFAVKNLPDPVFNVHFRSDEDWEAWEKISKLKGEFLYDAGIWWHIVYTKNQKHQLFLEKMPDILRTNECFVILANG